MYALSDADNGTSVAPMDMKLCFTQTRTNRRPQEDVRCFPQLRNACRCTPGRAQFNEQIRRQTEQNVARFAAPTPKQIDRRLQELDREWDMERTLEANAATAVLVGVTLGATVHRGFFFFPAVVAGFLLQHAVQGWCPPMPRLPPYGRPHPNQRIEQEKYALRGAAEATSAMRASDGRTATSAGTRQALEAAPPLSDARVICK